MEADRVFKFTEKDTAIVILTTPIRFDLILDYHSEPYWHCSGQATTSKLQTEINKWYTIEVQDWDELVQKTYGRPYSFQQQNGCQSRGVVDFSVPDESESYDEKMNDTIPEEVNGREMGVKFDFWLNRDPKQPIPDQKYDFELESFWLRNFYPDFQTVANDLYKRGLLEEDDWTINIDW